LAQTKGNLTARAQCDSPNCCGMPAPKIENDRKQTSKKHFNCDRSLTSWNYEMGFEVTFRYDLLEEGALRAPATVSSAFWPLFEMDSKLLKTLRLDSSFVQAYRTRDIGGDGGLDAWVAAAESGSAEMPQPGAFAPSSDDVAIPCAADDVVQWADTWLNLLERASDAILTELFLPYYGEPRPGWLNSSKMVIDPVNLKWGIDNIKDGLKHLTLLAAEAAKSGVGLICEIRVGA